MVFENVYNYQQSVARVIKEWQSIVALSITDNAKRIIELQQQQMLQGETVTMDKIGMYRDMFYAEEKYKMNSLAGEGFVDLKYTGGFFKDMFLTVTENEIIIFSKDEKASDLTKKYSNDIWGLQDMSIEQIIELVSNKLEQLLITKYGL